MIFMENSSVNKLFLFVLFTVVTFVYTVISHNFDVHIEYGMLFISFFISLSLFCINSKYLPYYIFLSVYFYVFSDNHTAMSPIDANKFYTEAFIESFYGDDHFSTVVATGYMYRLFSYFVNDNSPQILVSLNFIVHGLCVLFLLKCGRLFNRDYFSEKAFAFFGFMSPLLLSQMPYLIKDYFSVFFSILAFYYLIQYRIHNKYIYIVLAFFALITSMLFRVYSPIYTIMLIVITGNYSKYYIYGIVILLCSFFAVFGQNVIMYLAYSILAIYFIPNFLEVNNYLNLPFSTVESLLFFMVNAYVVYYLLMHMKKREIKIYITMISLIAITFAFTSIYRVTYSVSYDSSNGGGYLADNFFRKKLPIMYIFIFYFFNFRRLVRN